MNKDIKKEKLNNNSNKKKKDKSKINNNEKEEYIEILHPDDINYHSIIDIKNKDYKKKKRNKKNIISNIIVTIILIICILVLCYSGYKIFNWQQDNIKIKELTEKTEELANTEEVPDNENTVKVNPPEDKKDPYWDFIKQDLLEVDFTKLEEQNPDTVGWIYVADTNINYPVVQTNNNDYYLTRDYDEKWNDAGWIFMDYRNNAKEFDKNTVIYGHSRLDKSMFGTLRNITKKSWFNNKNNHTIKFSTKYENTLWQVFSVYTIKAEDYYITTSFKDNEYKTWLDTMKKRSIYNFNTSVTTDDKVMTLSSCYTTDGIRVVLHAKLIKEAKR